ERTTNRSEASHITIPLLLFLPFRLVVGIALLALNNLLPHSIAHEQLGDHIFERANTFHNHIADRLLDSSNFCPLFVHLELFFLGAKPRTKARSTLKETVLASDENAAAT